MSEVDYCITTMDRPRALERLLRSIAERQPEARIHIADQSRNFDAGAHRRIADSLCERGLHRPPSVHRLPFDCGVSRARNHLVAATGAEYILFLDDDFVFTPATSIAQLKQALAEHPMVGVAGGSVGYAGEIRNVGTNLLREGSSLRQQVATGPTVSSGQSRYRQVNCVPMFALMRRALFSHLRWDPALKTAAEHLDFFLEVGASPYTVMYMPDVIVDHPPTESSPDYAARRWRAELVAMMLSKHDLRRLQTVDGTIMELLADGTMIGYCELTR